MKKSICFDNFYIESPTGEKVLICALNAYAPDYRNHGILADKKRNEYWYGTLVDGAALLGECKAFIDAEFCPSAFLKLLKAKGYKVYWQEGTEEEIKKRLES